MSGVVANIKDGAEEIATRAGRVARRVAVTSMLAVAAAGGLATEVHGQSLQPRPIAVTPSGGVPQDVCGMASSALNSYVRANIARITDPADRAQLSILAQWIGAGCQGTVRLARTDQAIAAATHIQGIVGSRYNFNNVITLG